MRFPSVGAATVRPGMCWLSLVGLVLLGGCTPKPEGEADPRDPREPHEEHGEHAEHGEGDQHAEHAEHEAHAGHSDGAPNQLRIERGMLRDLRVKSRPAEARAAGDAVSVLGELRVNEEAYAEIGTSTPARVASVLAAPGDVVKAGQPLVELDSPEVGRARATLATAQAQLELARTTLERRRALAQDQIVPEREVQSAQAELSQIEAERQGAQDALAALGSARGQGSRFVLVSPVAGTVIERNALRGRMVDAQTPLFVVGDLQRLWLVVHAFERDALRMTAGATAHVTFPALPGTRLEGVVRRVGSRVDPASRTIEVRIELDNASGVLRPGMSATALVPFGNAAETVVTVPLEAVQRQPQGWCVFIPQKDEGVFELRPIGRGRDLGGEVEVLSGLRAGESVVIDGAFLLKAEADKARGGGEEHHH